MRSENGLHVTKPFMSGRSQVVRIPNEYHINAEEVYVNRVGSAIVITPKKDFESLYFSGLDMLTDDFMEEGRPEEILNKRTEL
jgi:antitoxin VapB